MPDIRSEKKPAKSRWGNRPRESAEPEWNSKALDLASSSIAAARESTRILLISDHPEVPMGLGEHSHGELGPT